MCVMVFVGQPSEYIFQRRNRCEGARVTVMEGEKSHLPEPPLKSLAARGVGLSVFKALGSLLSQTHEL